MATPSKIRILDANFRFEPVPADVAEGHSWPERRAKTVALIKKLNPQVITGQECSSNIRADVLAGLGGPTVWGYYRNGNVIVWINKAHVERVSYDNTIMLPSPEGSDPRRLVVVRVRLKATGDRVDVAASHFTVGDPAWQNKQMQAVVKTLTEEWSLRNSVFGADINNSMTAGECPRTIGQAQGLDDLRAKAGVQILTNETANTWNGWHPTIHASEWIDDVFFGRNLQPYYGEVVETDGASDHNWLRCSATQLNDET